MNVPKEVWDKQDAAIYHSEIDSCGFKREKVHNYFYLNKDQKEVLYKVIQHFVEKKRPPKIYASLWEIDKSIGKNNIILEHQNGKETIMPFWKASEVFGKEPISDKDLVELILKFKRFQVCL